MPQGRVPLVVVVVADESSSRILYPLGRFSTSPPPPPAASHHSPTPGWWKYPRDSIGLSHSRSILNANFHLIECVLQRKKDAGYFHSLRSNEAQTTKK